MFYKLKMRGDVAGLEKQTSTRSLLRFPKLFFDRWRSHIIVVPDANGEKSNNYGAQYSATSLSHKTQSANQTRDAGISPRKQPIIVQAEESKVITARKSSLPRDRQPRSQERNPVATLVPHSTNSSRSRSRSKLAFARSQSNPGYQRIIKVNDTVDHHKRETSRQRERFENRDHEGLGITRGRRSRHSSIPASTTRRSEDRTPSPLPDLGLTPAGTPCSRRSLEPSTPVRSEDDYQNIDAKALPPIIMTISPNQQINVKDVDGFSLNDFYAFPESYYRQHRPDYQKKPLDTVIETKSQQASCNNLNETPRHRKLVVDPNISDGSQLRSVSTGRARITANTSRISSVPVLAQDLPISPGPTPSLSMAPDNKVSSDISVHKSRELQTKSNENQQATISMRARETPSSSHQHKPFNPDLLPRKPASFERLRPSLTSYQAGLPSPPSEPRPSHRRTRSEAVNTEPPFMRSHTRSISSYSYTPSKDMRPERRSYNTVRILDSQGQNHERLRRVLGI